MAFNRLTGDEESIIVYKKTEKPFAGECDDFFEKGIFICKRCNNPLFSSKAKFDAGCGWPAFDDNFENSVKQISDKDGVRTEIICANCNGHLGHVFKGENFTKKNTRHCVNSLSIKFIPKDEKLPKILNER